jgi:hypothetical protein
MLFGAILGFSGITIVDEPLTFLTLMGLVLAIDIVSFIRATENS